MTYSVNDTHDPHLRSWVKSANTGQADFPIQNLPFGVFKRTGYDDQARVGIAIGDQILDVAACDEADLFEGEAAMAAACASSSLNKLMSLGPRRWSALRKAVSALLREGHSEAERHRQIVEKHLVPMMEAEMLMPVEIGDYTDFYASLYHATNVGSMFRPSNPLLPNYKYVPVGYHGRASSVVVSGTGVTRPRGQIQPDENDPPTFAPSKLLDYEMEIGFFVGPGNKLGEPVAIEQAAQHIFGLCLVNDWSARDIQKWEYQPLGPFLAKSFATTISPWVVTMEALAPFRREAFARAAGDPAPLAYLESPADQELGGIDLTLEVLLASRQMREAGIPPALLTRGNFRDMYWTIAQILTHHASNGCNLRPGDLIASGTVSGNSKESRGCLLELTWRGTDPVQLPGGETRRFLEDGDEVIMRGHCERAGFARIAFGECRGMVLSAGDV